MTRRLAAACLLLATSLAARESLPLTDGWEFVLTDRFTATAPPQAAWQPVSLPHDWSWEAGPRRDGAQEDKGGYRIGGVGWYRKQFTLPPSFQGKRVTARFDGAYRLATVFLNGQELGCRPYGFISFPFGLTNQLKPGPNTLTVRIDNTREPSTRWYHPCGLYAPVTLEASPAAGRLMDDGVFVSTPKVTAASATVRIQTEIDHPTGLEVHVAILDPSGKELARSTTAASAATATDLTIQNPALWSPDSPTLHTAVVSLRKNAAVVDEQRLTFGIRAIRWDAATGFNLNGQPVKLRGVCEHLTGGPVGGAWPEPLIEWKLRQLKSMGCNAIRTAHNPQVPAFYQLCDRLGLLVMNELFDGWSRKAPQDYGALHFSEWWQRDLTAWIRRDRNHPSVIIWSVGNETSGSIAGELVKLCHQLDPTRFVTSGASGSDAMDVLGINGHSETPRFFTTGPFAKPFVATEAPHTWQVRGFYQSRTWYRDGFNANRGNVFETPDLTPTEIFTNAFLAPGEMANRKQVFNSSYDNATVRINARQHWEQTRDLPWLGGSFRWTGFDYPGEAAYVHGGWPFHAFSGGALDLAGFEKDLYYFYSSQWTTAPMVHLLPHWTHPRMAAGTRIPVQAYSNADEVELFLNGSSLGTDRPGKAWQEMQCEWLVPWQPGTITAIARRGGKEVARDEYTTATSPARLLIHADQRFSSHPVLTLTTADAAGHPYPYGENRIVAAIDGPARILSFENGHPADPEPPVAASRRAFMGKARLFLAGEPTGITCGAILGERRQLTSKLVAIDVHRVKPDGGEVPAKFAIHYTLDGSPPTPASPLYQTPLPVPATCTVKAVVLLDGKPVLALEETFGPTLGLHWASAGEAPAAETAPGSGLQAEAAKSTGARVDSKGKGFHGSGYLDFKGAEGQVAFYQENDGPAAAATLVIRYAHADPKRQRPLAVLCNDRKAATVRFPSTGSWTDSWKTVEVPVALQPGANTITLRTTGQSAPNLDEIEIR